MKTLTLLGQAFFRFSRIAIAIPSGGIPQKSPKHTSEIEKISKKNETIAEKSCQRIRQIKNTMDNKQLNQEENLGLQLLKNQKIRRTAYEGKIYYAIPDLVRVLIEMDDTKDYISKMRKKDRMMSKSWRELAHHVPMQTNGGIQHLNCATAAGVFRILQSVQRPNSEKVKLWIASLAESAIKATNPELVEEVKETKGEK